MNVKRIQLFLRDRGFDPGPADGILGSKTVSALQRLLMANGFPDLVADGVMGPKTKAAYAAAQSRGVVAPGRSPSRTPTGAGAGGDAQMLAESGFTSVAELQQFLLGKGIAVGRADGIVGPKTRAGFSQAKTRGLFRRRSATSSQAEPGLFAPLFGVRTADASPMPRPARPPQPRDIVIPIAFPDYAITINTESGIRDAVWDPVEDEVLAVLDLLPGVDINDKGVVKSDVLGHAAIAYANGQTGFTRYWEYGRYDAAARGICRNVSVPDLKMTPDFEPDPDSLNRLFEHVSGTSGGGTRVAACFCRVPRGGSDKIENYCRRVDAATRDKSFDRYRPLTNSCLHFVKRAMREVSLKTPPVVDPTPRGYMRLLQMIYPALNWPDQTQDT